MRKWNGIGSPTTYLFNLFCFGIGFVVLMVLCVGQVGVDYSEGPGWNPLSRLPNGKLAVSDFTVSVIGFAVLMAVCVLMPALHR
jgi:hypothetical protein